MLVFAVIMLLVPPAEEAADAAHRCALVTGDPCGRTIGAGAVRCYKYAVAAWASDCDCIRRVCPGDRIVAL